VRDRVAVHHRRAGDRLVGARAADLARRADASCTGSSSRRRCRSTCPPGQERGKYDQNGQERQELNTGQTVWFQTRTRDGGRGLGKPKVIIDEAFKFKARIAGALLPILLAQHDPQLLYGSSEPPIDDPDAEVSCATSWTAARGTSRRSCPTSSGAASASPAQDPDCQHPKDALARGSTARWTAST
jgi:hypothetical protein